MEEHYGGGGTCFYSNIEEKLPYGGVMGGAPCHRRAPWGRALFPFLTLEEKFHMAPPRPFSRQVWNMKFDMVGRHGRRLPPRKLFSLANPHYFTKLVFHH